MLTYKSELPSSQPVSGSMRKSALAGILNASPYQYGSRHDDIYRGMAQQSAVEYDRAASKANATGEQEYQSAMRNLLLRGLGNMNDEQQARNRIDNENASLVFGFANKALGGLF